MDTNNNNAERNGGLLSRSIPIGVLKGRAVPVWLVLAVIIAAVLTAVSLALAVRSTYVSVTDDPAFPLCKANSRELDLRGAEDVKLSAIYEMKELRRLDIRECPISPEEYGELRAALPECEIIWSVPLGGRYVDSDSRALSLTDDDDLADIGYLTALEQIDAHGFTRYDELFDLRKAMPDVSFSWSVQVAGSPVEGSAESCALPASTTQEDIALLIDRLEYLPELRHIDARQCRLYDALLELDGKAPSDCEVEWVVELAGLETSSLAQSADISGRTVESASLISQAVQYLPNLTYLDMCDCGLSDKAMQGLCDAFPQTKFVWKVHFGDWTVRTDANAFSTLNMFNTDYSADVFEPLFRYCTDLVALDLGHNGIVDISGIANLKKLQGVILMDNPILYGLSALAELPELVYVEMNQTPVYDLSCFARCEKLLHLDVFCTEVSDLEPLHGCENLRYIDLSLNRISYPSVKSLAATLDPECRIITNHEAEGLKLRNNEIRSAFRLATLNWKEVESFVDYKNVTYRQGAELAIPKGYQEGE